MAIIGVITGDVVDSSLVEDRKSFARKLEAVVDGAGYAALAAAPEVLAGQVFRGDSFQLAFARPEAALELALAIHLGLALPRPESAGLGLEARLGVGVGRLDFRGEPQSLGTWTGEAFTLAAEALREAAAAPDQRLRIRAAWPALDGEARVTAGFVNHLLRRWSAEQAVAILGALEGRTQSAIAAEAGVGQPAISQRLQSAGWWPVRDAIARYRSEVLRLASAPNAGGKER